MIDFGDPVFWLLAGGSLLASLINASLAMGGAMLMLAISTSVLPLQAVIPMHSTLMMGSLIGRLWLFRQYIHWPIVIPFSLGCVIGVFAGARVYISLPEWVISLVIGSLMLSIWLPDIKLGSRIPKPFFWVGVIHSFLSTVFAYGGIFHAVLLRAGLAKMQVIGTIAGCLITMCLLKMWGYVTVGFDYMPYSWIIGAAILMSLLGTWIGKRCIHLISERHFQIVYKSLMTLLGIKLLFNAYQLY